MSLRMTRRAALKAAAALALPACTNIARPGKNMKTFDVMDFGARGDGKTPDTEAIQRAIDAASAASGGGAGKGRVLFPGGKVFIVGCLTLRSNIDVHLADDAVMRVSTVREDYHETSHGSHGGDGPGVLVGEDLVNVSFSGTGVIDGRSQEFMDHYEAANEWWRPKSWRPRLVLLTGCRELEMMGITIKDAPSWTVHLLGCERVLIDGITIANQLDVPNCDGIDPDHCREVEIKNCKITCGDDGIVIKTTRQPKEYGPSENIRVSDCVIQTQDSCVKLGTESVSDMRNIRFERCKLVDGCRGMCIQLRDEGNVSNIEFRDMTFQSRYFSDPWWGRGEGISFTAIPRVAGSKLGKISDVRVVNVKGVAENSLRIDGSPESRIERVLFDNVHVEMKRWTKYKGGLFDNRPTKAVADIEPHGTPGFFVRHADDVTLKNCGITWGQDLPAYFSHALEAHDCGNLRYPGFEGKAAHAGDAAIVID